MKILFPVAALLAVLGFAFAENEKPAAKPKALRVLMVTGGCCHDYENQKGILAEGLTQVSHRRRP